MLLHCICSCKGGNQGRSLARCRKSRPGSYLIFVFYYMQFLSLFYLQVEKAEGVQLKLNNFQHLMCVTKWSELIDTYKQEINNYWVCFLYVAWIEMSDIQQNTFYLIFDLWCKFQSRHYKTKTTPNLTLGLKLYMFIEEELLNFLLNWARLGEIQFYLSNTFLVLVYILKCKNTDNCLLRLVGCKILKWKNKIKQSCNCIMTKASNFSKNYDGIGGSRGEGLWGLHPPPPFKFQK